MPQNNDLYIGNLDYLDVSKSEKVSYSRRGALPVQINFMSSHCNTSWTHQVWTVPANGRLHITVFKITRRYGNQQLVLNWQPTLWNGINGNGMNHDKPAAITCSSAGIQTFLLPALSTKTSPPNPSIPAIILHGHHRCILCALHCPRQLWLL